MALLAGAVYVLAGTGAVERNRICAGVGLGTDTYGATAREALAAYVASRDGDPKHWRLDGATFEAADARAEPKGLARISAAKTGGVWRAVGGCVGNYDPPRPTQPRRALSNSTCDGSAFEFTAREGRTLAPFATWEFALRNTSARTCTVRGYPTLVISQNAYELSFRVLRRSGVLIDAPAMRPVELQPNESAFFVAEKEACAGMTAGPMSARIHIHGAGQLSAAVPGPFGLCGQLYDDDPILRTALVADLADAYRPSPATARCRGKDLRAELAGDATTDGLRAWTVRLINAGLRTCELRGTPAMHFSGPEVGLRYEFRDGEAPVVLDPGAAALMRFDKRECVQPETPISGARMRPPAATGLVDLPVPAGLQKCDFKDPGRNVIRFGPFEPAR